MYKYFNCSDIVPQCLKPQVEGLDSFKWVMGSKLGIKGQKGVKNNQHNNLQVCNCMDLSEIIPQCTI